METKSFVVSLESGKTHFSTDAVMLAYKGQTLDTVITLGSTGVNFTADKAKKTVGTYVTRANKILDGKDEHEVVHRDTTTPGTNSPKIDRNSASKISVELDVESGRATFKLGEWGTDKTVVSMTFQAVENSLKAVSLEPLNLGVMYFAKRASECASNPVDMLAKAVETANGHAIESGWMYGAYVSHKATIAEAKSEMISLASNPASFDKDAIVALATDVAKIEPIPGSRREAFAAKWLIKPAIVAEAEQVVAESVAKVAESVAASK